ncbi:GNAT family N-acetyltransferase [Haloferax sp. MBLA0076]|uniref:GNAT family N-acetyltransferase n=1 Tax=Haloferax litoreum TaxID=2666140 RepID=A0A6A8GDG9_9EURY|nr:MULTISPECIES: GNAT family protein [Haloferax]KAB1192711.1 GNAT family N-acetyltransferase [Haloferax sp. CBA1148]MRX21188.1 GNAT family N-acetyltransferase [Haloferax litoreum]
MPGARITSGERITLRTAETEDIPFLQRGGATPEIRFPLGNPVMNREQYEISDDRNAPDRFLVCLEDDDTPPIEPGEDDVTPIGFVGVSDAHFKRPELGYWLIPEVHGEGYGKAAVSLAIDYVFRQYDTPAVEAEAFDFNDASRGLLESLGFTEEGRKRKFMFVDGEYRDMIQYGLLREEWESET